MSYWVCHYHVVWATRERRPSLLPDEFGVVEAVVRSAFEEQRVGIHAVGCMSDHVHVVASIPPALAVADVVRGWKGSSSHLLNQQRRGAGNAEPFGWQAEYGIHTFEPEALPRVIAYAENQEERHRANDLWAGLERAATEPPARAVHGSGGGS